MYRAILNITFWIRFNFYGRGVIFLFNGGLFSATEERSVFNYRLDHQERSIKLLLRDFTLCHCGSAGLPGSKQKENKIFYLVDLIPGKTTLQRTVI
jgi:hypothetical protein